MVTLDKIDDRQADDLTPHKSGRQAARRRRRWERRTQHHEHRLLVARALYAHDLDAVYALMENADA